MKKWKMAFCFIGSILILVLAVTTMILCLKVTKLENYVASNILSQLRNVNLVIETEEITSETADIALAKLNILDEYLSIFDTMHQGNLLMYVHDISDDTQYLYRIIRSSNSSSSLESAKELLEKLQPYFAVLAFKKEEKHKTSENSSLLAKAKSLNEKIADEEKTSESLSQIHEKVIELVMKKEQ